MHDYYSSIIISVYKKKEIQNREEKKKKKRKSGGKSATHGKTARNLVTFQFLDDAGRQCRSVSRRWNASSNEHNGTLFVSCGKC